MSWFPAPDESPVSDQVHSGEGIQNLLNGFADIQGSYYGHKKYELNWSYLNRKQADLFRRLFMNRTGEWVTYADPFTMNNMLSPLMSLPYLHYYAATPLAFNDWGKQALFPTKELDSDSGHRGVILKPNILNQQNKFSSYFGDLNGRQESNSLSKPGSYTERVAIPEGYVGEFYIKGYEDGKQPFNWGFTSKDRNWGPTIVEANVKNRVAVIEQGVWEIEMSPYTEGHLSWCALRVTPTEGYNQKYQFISNPSAYYFSYPSGGGNLQVVPGTARIVTVNNARGHFTASVTLEEVWSW